jgi:hypothetical protein
MYFANENSPPGREPQQTHNWEVLYRPPSKLLYHKHAHPQKWPWQQRLENANDINALALFANLGFHHNKKK